ncbi:MAG: tripartite tricarboxylate transporter substrate binding protein [Betaproteobacteria bacterium]|nr:tripartite tricarboxylate transporter substrate binding protein [Betaproteobacteria bacterium]
MTLLLVLALASTAGAFAQDYPMKPIRMVVPYAAGGGVDIIARVIAHELSKILGQSVVVENRAGASGTIGGEFVAKAAPDGYTLLMIGTPYVIVPSLFARMPYDAVKDFAPISQVTSQPYIMGVHPSVPAKSVREFIALAKSRPGQLNYGSAGPGTTPHMATELLKTLTGIDLVHVPYNGGARATIALISGEITMLFGTLPPFLPLVKAGKIRPLAMSSLKRSFAAPELPTVAESGVPGFEVISWFGLLAPAKTPKEIVAKLHAEIAKLVRTPAIKGRLATDGSDPVGSTPEELGAYIQAEITKWGKVVRASGMRVD